MTPATPAPDQVRNNLGEGRFELAVGDEVAFLNYRVLTRGEIGLIHTEVPRELSGQGVGSALVEGTLLIAREKGWTVLPYCPFIHGWMRRDTRFADLISYRYPKREELLPPEPEPDPASGSEPGSESESQPESESEPGSRSGDAPREDEPGPGGGAALGEGAAEGAAQRPAERAAAGTPDPESGAAEDAEEERPAS